ncbi:hypothetical protein PYCCODRAFT_1292686 [Trametes coccinea BRFM310]|uniref:Uncharacterized protein n=1 Tax=Trametes coccinea (strain BRFM310) TaxID=1353009 RepID=A0A1Y2IYT9_TRAC3|nr:hypothetical protein PYCCODRAFT_1292686 [Trametes coccinea BRFM310]
MSAVVPSRRCLGVHEERRSCSRCASLCSPGTTPGSCKALLLVAQARALCPSPLRTIILVVPLLPILLLNVNDVKSAPCSIERRVDDNNCNNTCPAHTRTALPCLKAHPLIGGPDRRRLLPIPESQQPNSPSIMRAGNVRPA